ncbi:MAG: response regulator transcription factor [Bacteroidota bacterium]
MKVLLVEDEARVASFIKEGLEENGYIVEIASEGLTGRKFALANHYDIVLLDVIIPFLNGIDLCREIRKQKPGMPILMLTALSSTTNKLEGFDAGADDYLAKPFEFKELLARIKAVTNRTKDQKHYSNVLQVADLVLNLDEKSVHRANNKIDLTAKEYFLLELLMKNANRVLTRAEISEKVWDINFETGTNIVDVYIAYLRRKIDKDYPKKLIHTQFGIGYVLREEN